VAIGAVGLVAWYADRNGVGRGFACTTYGLLPSGNYPRLCSSFRNPNMHANYLIVAIAVILACGRLVARQAWVSVFAVVGTVVALFTLSAGMGGYALAAAVATIGVWRVRGVRRPARERVILAGAGVVALFFALSMTTVVVPPGQGQLTVAGRGLDLWGSSRPKIWRAALETFAAHPLLGKGYGAPVSFSTDPLVLLSPDQIRARSGPLSGWLEAHDIWLNVAGQSGVVGLMAFIGLLVILVRGLVPLARSRLAAGAGEPIPYSQGPRELQVLPVAVCAALLGAVAYHGIFGAFDEARHLWALLALAATTVSVSARASGRERTTRDPGDQHH
jgi:O-antigen ligase